MRRWPERVGDEVIALQPLALNDPWPLIGTYESFMPCILGYPNALPAAVIPETRGGCATRTNEN